VQLSHKRLTAQAGIRGIPFVAGKRTKREGEGEAKGGGRKKEENAIDRKEK
jgi:hypothetical protein